MTRRRGLLLGAVVLASAALIASVPERRREQAPVPGPPTVRPRPSPDADQTLRFAVGRQAQQRTVKAGAAATVVVETPEPGQVELLGVTATAQPLTPASFPVRVVEPGRYEIRFTPAGTAERRLVGTLAATP